MGIIASGRMERRKWILRELHRGGRFSEVKRAASPVTRETMEASGRQSRSVLGGPITDVFIGQSGVGV